MHGSGKSEQIKSGELVQKRTRKPGSGPFPNSHCDAGVRSALQRQLWAGTPVSSVLCWE